MKWLNTMLLCACFLLPATLPAAASPSSPEPAPDNGTEFALSLYRKLSISDDNLFLSPSSVETALSMTLNGARGRTESQMAGVLGITPGEIQSHNLAMSRHGKVVGKIEKKGGITLSEANSLFPQKGFRLSSAWLRDISRHYGAAITPVNYLTETEKARVTINRWVEKKTRERIRDLIGPGILDAMTRLTLVNAVYFNGDWEKPFRKENTVEAPFRTGTGTTAVTPFMHQTAVFRYAESGPLQLLELPYAGNDVSMLVVLPNKETPFSAIENTLGTKTLDLWEQGLAEKKVEVFLPRFMTTAAFRLDKVLKEMGMTDAFNENLADFSGMVDDRSRLFIGAVLHKAFVDVNEKGTEAAAATAVVMQLKSALPEPVPVFRADRPFLFLIREKSTGRILFIGRLNDPLKKG